MRTKIIILGAFLVLTTANAQILLGDKEEARAILKIAENFSTAMMAGDSEAILSMYTEDAKIFPVNRQILSGDDLATYWAPENVSGVTAHKFYPEEISVMGDTAYDYGYYAGTSENAEGASVNWKGKYVVVWKKTAEGWKIYLDSWSRVKE